MKKPNLGQKQTCKKCEARFFDLNKNPAVCPKCGEIYKISKTKTRRAVAQPLETETKEAAAGAPGITPSSAEAPEKTSDGEEITGVEGEEDLEDDSEDDDLMEDTSDIGEDSDELSEVLEHVDDGVDDK